MELVISKYLNELRSMKKWLNTYFGLSKREFNGLLMLIVLIVTVGLIPYIYGYLKPNVSEEAHVQRAIQQLIINHEAGDNRSFKENKPATRRSFRKVNPFYFDPNKIGIKEWQSLGLSERQAAAILRYLAKGGQFRKPEDLRKMYTINEKICDMILPYVRIETVEEELTPLKGESRKGMPYIRPQLKIIELNGADSLDLEDIRGIGPVFAKRIIKYRDRLGGFYNKEQLMEVFGLDSLKFKEIREQIMIDELKLKKININTAVFEDFRNHPYLRYKQVNALIQYRKQHGNYSNIADLNKVAILDPETIAKLAPYFIF